MASLEELLYTAVTTNVDILAKLAKYANKAAFFEIQTPADTDDAWGAVQYPRADYIIDRVGDPERQTEGTAAVSILTTTSAADGPEVIEAIFKGLLDGAVFHPTNEPVIALRWTRSEPFEEANNRKEDQDIIIGVTMLFDVLAFPSQQTTSPDPIVALNTWTAAKFATLQVDPATWAPTDANPAIYWRLAGINLVQAYQAHSMFDANIAGHLMAKTTNARLSWLKQIIEALANDTTIIMDDGSPMMLQGTLSADSQGDPLRAGQIRLTIRFGVLKPPGPVYEELTNPAFTKI
jgi:hypothetical protein